MFACCDTAKFHANTRQNATKEQTLLDDKVSMKTILLVLIVLSLLLFAAVGAAYAVVFLEITTKRKK